MIYWSTFYTFRPGLGVLDKENFNFQLRARAFEPEPRLVPARFQSGSIGGNRWHGSSLEAGVETSQHFLEAKMRVFRPNGRGCLPESTPSKMQSKNKTGRLEGVGFIK